MGTEPRFAPRSSTSPPGSAADGEMVSILGEVLGSDLRMRTMTFDPFAPLFACYHQCRMSNITSNP